LAIDSEAEKMMIKLLIHNKLITKSQIERILKKTVGRSKQKLHEELVQKRFVDPKKMTKIVTAIEEKGLIFPLLCDQTL
jgi:hypothetical protein